MSEAEDGVINTNDNTKSAILRESVKLVPSSTTSLLEPATLDDKKTKMLYEVL